MAKFECKKCTYKTNHKAKFDAHLNRKIPCNKLNVNKNIKLNNVHYCEKCNKKFSRDDSLQRHNKIFHVDINTEGNNNKIITGNNNIQTNVDNSTHLIVNNPIVIQPVIKKYDEFDVNDLTIYEQYLSLTSKDSPYTALLDNLNLNPTKEKYQNMKYKDIHKNIIDVHDGNIWIGALVNKALSSVVCSERIMIGLILNRFRCFLGKKATKLIPKAYYYGYKENYYFHKKIIQNIKYHLYYHHKKTPINATQSMKKIPHNKDEIWWALSKRFHWNEVEKYIMKMDKYEINFDNDLDEIKKNIKNICIDKPKLKKFFNKLMIHIDSLIDDFAKSVDSDVSSEEMPNRTVSDSDIDNECDMDGSQVDNDL